MIPTFRRSAFAIFAPSFPGVMPLIGREREVVITDRGKANMFLRLVKHARIEPHGSVDYFTRLKRRHSKRIGRAGRKALDEVNRAER
ncbi:MAG: hypothetical protein FD180_525 [Planctomycetota bacterium]|nr:MAG: hypothetical protein FD180_525 [Planctomycetota bacterium]